MRATRLHDSAFTVSAVARAAGRDIHGNGCPGVPFRVADAWTRMLAAARGPAWMAILLWYLPALAMASAAATPAGPVWQLRGLGGESVTANTGTEIPSLVLEPGSGKASGFAGCNRFFGGYELTGNRLALGPLGATRMACGEVAGGLEARFMDMLARVDAWSMEGTDLLLSGSGTVLARFTAAGDGPPDAGLGDMTLRSAFHDAGPVTLVDGEYRAPAAPGSAADVVIRLLDGQPLGTVAGRPAAVAVLSTSTGGSGRFVELALLFRDDGRWHGSDTVLLGDRVRVDGLRLEDGQVIVAMTVHAEGDPLCCPTLSTARRFRTDTGHLVEITGDGPAN